MARQAKPFPNQERLHQILNRQYDVNGKLFFVNKVKRPRVEEGKVLYGNLSTFNKGKQSEHQRYRLSIDGYTVQMSIWNYIYEYGDYDRNTYSIDHIDKNPLNDHHINLRLADESVQNKNRKVFGKSIYRGIYETRYNTWLAQININGNILKLGTYKTDIEAAIAFDDKSWETYRDLTHLNFPQRFI